MNAAMDEVFQVETDGGSVITMHVRGTGVRVMMVRLRLASWLMTVAARLAGVVISVDWNHRDG